MVYAVAILLVSSLTSVGLFAIWAATSRAHWFWRTMLFLGAMSPLLLIPAYEPFLAFVIQGAVVAAGIQLVKWRAARKRSEPFFRTRFSLRTILLAMVPVAVLVAASVQIYEANDFNGIGAVQIGGVAGLTSLLGFWMASGRLRLGWRIIIGAALAIGFTLLLQWNEWFVSQMDTFDFESSYNPDDWQKISYWKDRAVALVWLTAIALSVICTALMLWLVGPRQESFQTPRSLRSKLAIGFFSLFLLAPSSIVFYLLIDKLPIPEYKLPDPNGYDDFLAAEQMLPVRVIVRSGNFDENTTSLDVVRKGVDEIGPALERVRLGLSKPCWKPHNYESSDALRNFQPIRQLAAGFRAKGKLAEREANNYSVAADTYLELIKYGHAISHGGMIHDLIVGVCCTDTGYEYLFSLPDSLPGLVSQQLIEELARIENQIEPLEDIVHRDKVWCQHGFGWLGHLLQDLEHDILHENKFEKLFLMIYRRDIAYLRLLRAEFALRAWKSQHHEWPESLDVLVPDYLPAIANDPYSPENLPLQYKCVGSDYLLYSVGANGIDEAGKAGYDNGYRGLDPFTGDFRLDIEFAPETTTPMGAGTQPENDQSDEDTAEP